MTQHATSGQPVGLDASDGVLIITINRPEVRNAINAEVAKGIAGALDLLDRRGDLAVGVLTGAGGTFCAGMDLKAFLAGEQVRVAGRGFGGIAERSADKPLIAAVEGWAVGGGCEIALACDLIVAAVGARFGIPEVKRGLMAAAGGLLRLPERLPYHIAMELSLTGDPIDADRAAALGLVNVVAEDGQALDAALELAARIAKNAPLAVRASKQVIVESAGWAPDEAFARQEKILAPVRSSEDAREGARAFAEKRAPVWGRQDAPDEAKGEA